MRYSVLTYNIGGYEKVHEIWEKDPEAEYIMVTDVDTLTSETWTVVRDTDLEGLGTFEKCHAIRFNPFKYCHSDICVRLDANISIRKSLKPLIDIFEKGKYDICLMPHPRRCDFREEYQAWVDTRGYDAENARRILDNMRSKGYDFEYKGLFQSNFWIQRRNAVTEELNTKVHDLLRELGHDGRIERINQVPFSFVMNMQYSHLKVLPVSEQVVRSIYMQWHFHNSHVPNMQIAYDITKPDMKWMFNREVECLYLLPESVDELLPRVKYLENEVWQEQVRGREQLLKAIAEYREELEKLQEHDKIYLDNALIKPIRKLVRAYRKHVKKENLY